MDSMHQGARCVLDHLNISAPKQANFFVLDFPVNVVLLLLRVRIGPMGL